MHSIPEYIQKINITMGYPANHTAVAAFITLLCDLRNFAKQEKNETYYYYKPVIALLNHKFIKNLCPDDIYQITNYIHQKISSTSPKKPAISPVSPSHLFIRRKGYPDLFVEDSEPADFQIFARKYGFH